MNFKVVSRFLEQNANTVYLVSDSWDDWFTYSTLYNMKYINEHGRVYSIGGVKIGQRDQNERKPQLSDEFEHLDDGFFSLGSSEYYYQQLSGLGEVIRECILSALNDIAMNLDLLSDVLQYDVTNTSLLRDKTLSTVRGQYHRMAKGGARLTNYDFSYSFSKSDLKMEFEVIPEQVPPTNIHVLIGKNGVGKTTLIKKMLHSLESNEIDDCGQFEMLWSTHNFANIVLVSFSIFDAHIILNDTNVPYLNIGITKADGVMKKHEELASEFAECLYTITKGDKKKLWFDAITLLESDNTFIELNIKSWSDIKYETREFQDLSKSTTMDEAESKRSYKERLEKMYFAEMMAPKFKILSSGHKVILLTIAKLVETVEEQTLVLLDEPEEHLHPPLVSAFIRALSNLLIYRNGVGIIATHSPVIVQEVPRKCVWVLRRSGNEIMANRPQIETFGENLGVLTSEIFGFEVTNSGFHKMLNDATQKYATYSKALREFDGEIGEEGKTILRCLMYEKEVAEDNKDD